MSARQPESVQFTQRERDLVFAVAMKYLKDEEQAHDVAQDALLLAYRHRADFRGDARFSTWLYRIASTTALMHLRRERNRPRPQSLLGELEDESKEPSTPRANPEESSAAREVVHLADRRLAAMGEKYSTIFAMHFVEGYSESEIARKLALNVSTVKTRAYRARVFLKKELAHVA